jgi:hypothetical protein
MLGGRGGSRYGGRAPSGRGCSASRVVWGHRLSSGWVDDAQRMRGNGRCTSLETVACSREGRRRSYRGGQPAGGNDPDGWIPGSTRPHRCPLLVTEAVDINWYPVAVSFTQYRATVHVVNPRMVADLVRFVGAEDAPAPPHDGGSQAQNFRVASQAGWPRWRPAVSLHRAASRPTARGGGRSSLPRAGGRRQSHLRRDARRKHRGWLGRR